MSDVSDISKVLLNGSYIYDNNLFNDVVFDWEDEQIEANKAILSLRSKYFLNLFTSGLSETETGIIKMYDYQNVNGERIKLVTLEPYDIHLFLLYIYKGSISNDLSDINRLLTIAQFYQEDLLIETMQKLFDDMIRRLLTDEQLESDLSSLNELSKRLFNHPISWELLDARDIRLDDLSNEDMIEIIKLERDKLNEGMYPFYQKYTENIDESKYMIGESMYINPFSYGRNYNYFEERLWNKVKDRPDLYQYVNFYMMNVQTLKSIPKDVIANYSPIDSKHLFTAPILKLIQNEIPFVGIKRGNKVLGIGYDNNATGNFYSNSFDVIENDYLNTLPDNTAIMFDDIEWNDEEYKATIRHAVASSSFVPYVLTNLEIVQSDQGNIFGKYYHENKLGVILNVTDDRIIDNPGEWSAFSDGESWYFIPNEDLESRIKYVSGVDKFLEYPMSNTTIFIVEGDGTNIINWFYII